MKKTNDLIFVVESDDPDQKWTGNVKQAFEEFFEAHDEWRALSEKVYAYPDSDVSLEDLPPETGAHPDDIFEASNGLRIWWHNPHVPEEMRPRPSKEDLEKVLEMLRSEKEDGSGEEE